MISVKRTLNNIIIYVFLLSMAIMGYFSLNVDMTQWFVRFVYISIFLGFIAIFLNVSYLIDNITKIRRVLVFSLLLVFLNIINEYGEGHYLRALMILCSISVGFIIGVKFGLRDSRSFYKVFGFVLFPLVAWFTFRLNGNIDYGSVEGYVRDKLFLLPLLFPFVIVLDYKKYNLLSLIILTICSFISLKRSMVVVALLLLPMFFYYYMPNRNKNRVLKFVLFIGIVMGLNFIFPKLDEALTNGVVVERFNNSQEDGGSGRDEIYTQYITILQGSSPRELLFGQHTEAYIITGNAHNDILMVTYRYGLVGLVSYLSIIILFIRQAVSLFKNKKFNDTGRVLIWSTSISFVVLGMLNCFFDQCSFYYGMLLIGFITGLGVYYTKVDNDNSLKAKI